MNNQKFISTLKGALSGMDKSSRDDILQEIQSHAKESGDTLLERFGTPANLAKQYLEGEVVARPLSSKIWGISKKVFVVVGAFVLALILVVFLLIWWLGRDAFDYADESASELAETGASWVTVQAPDTLDINIEQASTVFYWHDEPTMRHSCKGENPVELDGSKLTFSRSKCLVYLPKKVTTITAHQSQIVLVRPQHSLDLELVQSQLQIAENGTSYRYAIEATRTQFEELASVSEADVEIRIKSEEATISKYSY